MDIPKPSQIDTKNHFFNSVWEHCETETVARNIVLISEWNDDEWKPFTWEQYKDMCKHKVSNGEYGELTSMAKTGHLDHNKKTDTFAPNIRFVAEVSKWKKA